MSNNVVLFLTSPNSSNRIEMCLRNFKQLEKLGYDIITLTTTDLLPNYIYEKSKFVMHDYTSHVCTKKDYKNYFKNTNGLGYFISNHNESHSIYMFHDTHFPSLLRNIRSLQTIAKVYSYEKYFYVEDDHFFHDDDLEKINQYFSLIGEHDLIFFNFRPDPNTNIFKRCSYFNFGNVGKMYNIAKQFAYNENDYKNTNKDIYLNFFETVLTLLINTFKSPETKILDETEYLNRIFKKSSLNQVYSYRNYTDNGRCNFVYNPRDNNYVLYYSTCGLEKQINLKIVVGNTLHSNLDLNPGCWFYTCIESDWINNTVLIINDSIVKSFKNLNLNDIIYNGEIIFN